MATINVGDNTKKRFKRVKLKVASEKGKTISEDDFIVFLLDKLEESSNARK